MKVSGIKECFSKAAAFLDSPKVVGALEKRAPLILIGGGGTFAAGDTIKNAPKEQNERNAYFLKNTIITAAALAGSMLAVRGLAINGHRIFKGLVEDTVHHVHKCADELGDAAHKHIHKHADEAGEAAHKHAHHAHKHAEHAEDAAHKCAHHVHEHGETCGCGHDHEDFKTILRLTALGVLPVAGGVLGGVAADKITGLNSKKTTADKLKEGLFQFLANIALCNVGAAVALGIGKLLHQQGLIKKLEGAPKMAVMLAGVVGAGVIGGSAIANHISKKVINPAFGEESKGKLYDERKPEALDVALHVDDFATSGVVAGFKWIAPIIPLFYFISGYRTGIGYRNGQLCTHVHLPLPKSMTQFAHGSG